MKDFLVRGAEAGGVAVDNNGLPVPLLNVYESLKLIAAERPDTRPCGMFPTADNNGLQFWRLQETDLRTRSTLACRFY